MRILLWHIHGSYTTSLVQGDHRYVLPVEQARGPDGIGRFGYPWPDNAVEIPVADLREQDVDVVVLQRPHEAELVRQWLGREPGRDLPAVYLEHNTPGAGAWSTRHHLAEHDTIPIVHVTHFNRLMWDSGQARTVVIEHGIVDPGHRYSGDEPRAAVVVNEPVRRGRAVGTDLLPMFAEAAPLDVFGIAVDLLHGVLALPADRLRTYPGLSQEDMHTRLARCRVYVHPHRWTSLGLSLLEAMHLGMPVVVVGCTETPFAVPPEAGCLSVRPDELTAAVRRYVEDPDAAREAGAAAREAALARYGLKRFLDDWDQLLAEVAG